MSTINQINFAPYNLERISLTKSPVRSSNYAAGYDLHSSHTKVIQAGEVNKISTNISVEIPNGMWGKIEARSGLASKHGVQILGGVIDSDYRGEIIVMMTTIETFVVDFHDRIAQLVILPHLAVPSNYMVGIPLSETERGDNGFGSTGK